MEQVVSTILFDGQYWLAIIEKTDANGVISIGKHIFGSSEPTIGSINQFYPFRLKLLAIKLVNTSYAMGKTH